MHALVTSRYLHKGQQLTSRDARSWARFARSDIGFLFSTASKASNDATENLELLLSRLTGFWLVCDPAPDKVFEGLMSSNERTVSSLRLLPTTLLTVPA
jgi:hypothetical protein